MINLGIITSLKYKVYSLEIYCVGDFNGIEKIYQKNFSDQNELKESLINNKCYILKKFDKVIIDKKNLLFFLNNEQSAKKSIQIFPFCRIWDNELNFVVYDQNSTPPLFSILFNSELIYENPQLLINDDFFLDVAKIDLSNIGYIHDFYYFSFFSNEKLFLDDQPLDQRNVVNEKTKFFKEVHKSSEISETKEKLYNSIVNDLKAIGFNNDLKDDYFIFLQSQSLIIWEFIEKNYNSLKPK